MAKKILIEFSWVGNKITQFIDKDVAFADIAGKEDFWGEFVVNGTKFQYQIWWNGGKIAIFKYGEDKLCDMVDNFSVNFSAHY
jgi:hypothetical protein